MKKRLKHIAKSIVALSLAMCMVFDSSMTAFATGTDTEATVLTSVADVNGDGKINYVSFGDSVTNGYGMEGYRYADGTNTYGFMRKAEDAYPSMITKYLEQQFGEGNVELSQMAISSFRMDELHAMLDEDGSYTADDYHVRVFGSWNRRIISTLLGATDAEAVKDAEAIRVKYSNYANDEERINNADAIIGGEYRDAVRNADLITIDLGTNNFGTFMTNKLTDLLGMSNNNYEMDFTQFMDEASYQSLEAMLCQMVAEFLGTSEGQAYTIARELAITLLYGYLGFSENYDDALDEIYRLNPDAQVVVIDVYNMMSGVSMKGTTFGENIDLAAIYEVFVNLANFYAREISPYAQKVTHASLDSDPGLFFDLYTSYPEEPLSASAERLLEEFIMESMGYDPDYPSEREAFQREVKDSIMLLDTYVSDIQKTVEDNVVATITDGVQTAVDGVDAAVEGVPAAKQAVKEAVDGVATAKEAVTVAAAGVPKAEAAVDTAIEGVAAAQNLLAIIVEKVVGNEMFSPMESIKTFVINTIVSELESMDLTGFGFENTEEDRQLLAEEIYVVACNYYNTEDKEEAEKAGIIELMRFSLVETKDYEEENAQATAMMAYQLNAVYEVQGRKAAVITALQTEVDAATAELAYQLYQVYEAQGEEAAVKAAMASQVGEETAELAYQLNAVYEAQGEEAAVTAALASQVGEETAALALQLYQVYEAAGGSENNEEAKYTTVITAIVNSGNGYTEEQAAAMYRIYLAVTDEDAATVLEEADLITVLAAMNVTEEQAKSVYACYLTDEKNGKFEDEDVKTTMVALMLIGGIAGSADEAVELYDSYVVYKKMPMTFSLIAKNKTLYIDYLLKGDIDLGSVIEKFKKGELVLEYPGDDATDAEKEQYYSDSSLATMYMRFISQDGVFIHPSEVGQKELAESVKSALKELAKSEGEDEIQITSSSKILSIGDSIAAAENNYGQLVAKDVGTENYSQFAANGLRINEIRALIDDDYAGDEYTEAVLNQVAAALGADKEAVSNKLKSDIASNDVIMVNLGAMNLGYVAVELQKYTTEGTTYPMEFSKIDNMTERNLGAVIDGLLGSVQGMVESSEAAPLMLALESYGYGLTTYTDCINETIDAIRAINEDADIILVGQYDMLGDATFSSDGLSFAMGDFFALASEIMNGHLEKYAQMHKDCSYVDVTDTETVQSTAGTKLNLVNAEDVQKAVENAHPTANGHEYIKNQIVTCDYEKPYEKPARVTTLTAVNQKTTIKLSWDKVEDADGYIIYRREYASESAEYKEIKTITDKETLSCTDGKISQGNRYIYSIAAYRDAEDGTRVVGDKLASGTQIVRVKIKTMTNQNGSVKITWTKVPNVAGYKVYRKAQGQDSFKLIKTIKSGTTVSYTDKTDKTIRNGKKSVYKVVPYYSSSSKVILASNTPTHYYLNRQSIKSVTAAKKAFTVKWTKNSSAKGYEVWYSTSSSFENATKKRYTTNSTVSKKYTGLKAGKKYYVKVRSYKTVNGDKIYSAWSAVKNVKTK